MTRRYLGRDLTDADLEAIRAIRADPRFPTRAAIAREVCHALGWVGVDGKVKDMSAKVALAAIDADGLIGLLAPTDRPVRPGRHLETTIEAGPPIACRLNEPDNIAITICAQHSAASIVSNRGAMIGGFHHLGHTRASGAQLRYSVTARTGTPIAATGFAASAWALEDRDTWIGWDRQARKARLQLVVGNPRFFVAPPVRVAHLASHLPGTITARQRADRQDRYGYQPALVETFVEAGRHRSTCYQAANRTRVGQTNRRGKLDRYNTYPLPVKDIHLHPLVRGSRRQLTAALHPS